MLALLLLLYTHSDVLVIPVTINLLSTQWIKS